MTLIGNTLGLSKEHDRNDCGGDEHSIGAFISRFATDTIDPPFGCDHPYPPGTTLDWRRNGSTAFLAMPPGSVVVYAELIWGGSYDVEGESLPLSLINSTAVVFETPTATRNILPGNLLPPNGPTTPGGGTAANDGDFYIRSANVTSLVQAAGSGRYLVGNVPALNDDDSNSLNAAGWTLVVIYAHALLPLRNMTVFVGMAESGEDPVTISGFCTPRNGRLSARLGVSAIEGDSGLDGDALRFGETSFPLHRAEGPRNDKNNFFASQITDDFGRLKITGSFGLFNHPPGENENVRRQGWDIANVDVSRLMRHDQSRAFVQGTTDGDAYLISTLVVQTDVTAPDFSLQGSLTVDKTKTFPGDVLTYTSILDNRGELNAEDTTYFVELPEGLEFIPGSFKRGFLPLLGADPVAGVPLGTIFEILPVRVSFQVRVLSAPERPAPASFATTAYWTYRYEACDASIDGRFTTRAAVTDVARILAAKFGSPTTVVAGEVVTFTVAVANDSDAPAFDVVLTDPIPAGTTYIAGSTRMNGIAVADVGGSMPFVNGGTVNSAGEPAGQIDPHQTALVQFQVRIAPGFPAGVLTNAATVDSDGLGPTPPIPITADVTVIRAADVQVTLSGTATASPGQAVTYTTTVLNNGLSAAGAVVLTLPTPPGLVLTSSTGGCGAGSPCNLGTLFPGQSRTATWNYDVPAGYTAPDPIVVTASVGSAGVDPVPANNTASTTTALSAPLTDLTIALEASAATIAPLDTLSYTLDVGNEGPSAATAAPLTATWPANLTGVTWTCTAAGGATCPAPAGSGDISAPVNVPLGGTLQILASGSVAGASTSRLLAIAQITPGPGQSDPTPNVAAALTSIVSQADLAVVKTGPAVVAAGSTATYTLTVTNNGPSDALAVVVDDPTPPLLTFVSATGDCETAMPCAFATVPAGGTRSIVVTYRVDALTTAPPPIVNTATVSSDTSDPQSANNTSSVTTEVDTRADVGLTAAVEDPATPGNTSFVQGQEAEFVIRAENFGPNAATAVLVNSVVPAGTTLVSATTTAGTYAEIDGVWQVGVLGVGSAAELRLRVVLAEPGVSTSVSIKSGQTEVDPRFSNNIAVAALNAAANSDIGVTVTVDQSAPLVGDTVTFTATITNAGPSDAVNVLAQDPPAGLTNLQWTCAAFDVDANANAAGDGDTSCSAASGSGPLSLPVNVGADPGDEVVFTITATVATPAPMLFVVSVDLSAATPTLDLNPANNQDAVPLNGVAAADLSVIKSRQRFGAVVGSEIDFAIVVRNHGPSAAVAVTATDLLPPGLSFVTAVTTQGSYDSTTGVWTIGDLPATAFATMRLRALVTTVGSLINTATVTAATTDPDPANNTSSVTIATGLESNLTISKSDGLSTAVAGQAVRYVVLVENLGPSDVAGATVNDPLPPQIASASWTCTAAAAGSCGAANGAGGVSTTVDLPAGSRATFVVDATISPSAIGTISNVATVSVPGDVTDPDLTDNTASDDTALTASADLAVSASGLGTQPGGAAIPGGTIDFTFTIANSGLSTASAASFSFPLPQDLVFSTIVSASPGLTCGEASGNVTCTAATVTPGTLLTVVVRHTVPPGYPPTSPDPVAGAGSVTAATPDPNAENNTSTALVPINASAVDLQITKTDGVAIATPGLPLTYTITVRNAGPSNALNAIVTDTLPAVLSNGMWTCAATDDGADGDTSCPANGSGSISALVNLGTESNDAVVFTLTATLAVDATGVVLNVARAVPAAGAADLTSAIAADLDMVVRSADLTVTKTALTPVVSQGGTATYSITITNNGPNDAEQVTASDPGPAGFRHLSTTGDCTTALPCTFATIPATGANSRTFVVSYQVGQSVPDGVVTNTVAITSGTLDPTPSPTASAMVTVGGSADIRVVKTASSGSAPLGTDMAFLVTAANDGPSNTAGVVVSDVLPSGLTFVSAETTFGAYDALTGQWTIGNLPRGAVAPLVIVARPAVLGAITNTAIKTASGEPDPVAANDQDSASLTADPSADMSVTTTANTLTRLGASAQVIVTARNLGPSPATNVILSGNHLGGMSYTSHTASAGVFDPATAQWSLPTMAAGAEATLTLTLQVDTDGPILVMARTLSQSEFDPVSENNRDEVVFSASAPATADISVGHSVSPPTASVGDEVTFTVTATNLGPDPAVDVVVEDAIPAGLELVSATTSSGSYSFDRWTIGDLEAGETAIIDLVVRVTSADLITNTARYLTDGVTDTNPDNDVASATVDASEPTPPTPPTRVDVAIWQVLTRPLTPADPSVIAYSLWNLGPDPAHDIEIEGDFPRTLIVDSLEPTAGGTCETTDVPGALRVRCLWPGVTERRTRAAHFLVARMRPTAGVPAGTVIGWTMASRGTDPVDPRPDNNTLVSQIVVAEGGGGGGGVTDAISITGVVDGAGPSAWALPVRVGDDAVARFVVTNSGATVSRARYALRLNEPGAVDVVSAAMTQGTVTVLSPVTAEWDLGDVPAGGRATLELHLQMRTLTAARIDATRLDVAQGSSSAVVLDGVGAAPSGGRWVAAGNLDGAAGDEIVTGTGVGDSPQVAVFSTAGRPLASPIDVFARAFRGGVRVASCDLDGDGRAEVVAGQGPGGSRIRILRLAGTTLTSVSEVTPFEADFAGGVSVACADLEGDGRAEVLVGAGAGRAPEVRVYAFTSDTLSLLTSYLAFDAAFTGGVRVAAARTAAADARIVTVSGPGRPLEMAQWQLTAGGAHELVRAVTWWPEVTGGAVATLGDADGDGQLDLFVAPDTGEPGLVRVYALPSFALLLEAPSGAAGLLSARFAVAQAADGAHDIIVADGPGGMPRMQGFRWSPATLPEKLREFLALEIPPGPPQ